MVVPVLDKHIEITPGVCGGKPRIVGHRIRVQDIAVWHEFHLSPDEIVAQFPQITLADIYAALSYYHDHREEIHRQMEEAEKLAERLKKQNPSRLPQIPTGTDDGDDPVSLV
jgi:uncharacterized protein (DUF433 family)